MKIHAKAWSGCGSLKITDMTNAGKRGKQCRTLTFQGWLNNGREPEQERAHSLARVATDWAEKLDPSTSFEDAESQLRAMVAQYQPIPEHACRIFHETVRGVDAPRPLLTAGVDGKWHAKADETGIFIADDVDRNNEPAMCTPSAQSNVRAYELAAKVWEQVKACATFSQVGDVLRDAECRLHYWCRMD